MKKFCDFIKEAKTKSHSNGTYVQAKVSSASQTLLNTFVKSLNLNSPLVDKTEYHSTITYSRKGIPEVEDIKFETPFDGRIKGWEVFPMQTGDKCLVALVDSKTLVDYHTMTMKMGATYDFPEYKPHITISVKFDGEVPKSLPDFDIRYDSVDCSPLDPEYKAKVE